MSKNKRFTTKIQFKLISTEVLLLTLTICMVLNNSDENIEYVNPFKYPFITATNPVKLAAARHELAYKNVAKGANNRKQMQLLKNEQLRRE